VGIEHVRGERRGIGEVLVTTGTATQQQIATFQQVFDALFDFLQWTYGVVLSRHDRSAIESRVLSGWAHPDGSVRELLTYFGGLHTVVFSQPAGRRDRYRPDVQRIFAKLFAAPDPTERGQVIALLHRTLEQASPRCTGVAPAPYQPPHQPYQASPGSGPTVGPTPAPFQAAAQPFPYVTSPAPGPAAGMTPNANPGLVPGSGGGQLMGDVPDVQRLTMEAQIRQQKLLFEQKLWDMQHNAAMEVIRSMR
jgi:hypothetical protein